MSSVPVVPQRPARSSNRDAAQESPADIPKVPPRPQRLAAGSKSREREASARSPLNDTGFAINGSTAPRPANHLTEEELRRPPSVASLPLIGQEGMEYASLSNPQIAAIQKDAPASQPKSPHETRNVASDLPLHAPKASASPMAQKTRVAAVTRTDSEQASIAGVGKPKTEYAEPEKSPLGQYRPPSTASTERPSSSQAQSLMEVDEQGIPTFGVTVPLLSNAGDVQAPTPAPSSAGLTPNELSRPGTSDGRRRSAHGFHGPPGSYGMHGHGHLPHDKFEKAWYERHPEELAKEEVHLHHSAAHDEKPTWAMSSDELNKLVHETARSSSGCGTNPDMIGTPTEVIGYEASAEYSDRAQTPHVTPHHTGRSRTSRPDSASYAESPLKKSFSAQEASESSPTIDNDRVHVIPPTRPQGKYSGAGYDPPTENLGPTGGNTEERGGWVNEKGEGVPILASDELAKYPSAEWMQPAVSPARQVTEDDYYSATESDTQPSYLTHRRNRSKDHSRPSSMHSYTGLSRFNTHEEGTGTPLEEIDEYEPLFDDKGGFIGNRPRGATAVKRPDTLKQQHFPSRDIWEDTPDSLRLEATVDTPEPAAPARPAAQNSAAIFEPPDAERKRQGEFTEAERKAALQDTTALQDPQHRLAKPKFKAGVQEEVYQRPGLRQRFPSQDIWEDTPDSLRLETTIDNEAVNVDAKSPEAAQKSTILARPVSTKEEPQPDAPTMPARPQPRDVPGVSDKPKPTVPHRPARSLNKEPSDPSSLAKTTSADSATSAEGAPSVTTAKPKPTPPARPSGSSKFASIKAGFMSDLNSRLSKGAPPPKPAQEEIPREDEEKTPLGDARKSRARGPQRRKPAASPTPPTGASIAPGQFSVATPWTVWSLSSNDLEVATGINTISSEPTPSTKPASIGELPTSSPLATNTAGERLAKVQAESPGLNSGVAAHPASSAMDARAHRESAAAKERLRALEGERIGHEGDVPDPIVDQPTGTIPPIEEKAPEEEGVGAPLSPQKGTSRDNPMEIVKKESEESEEGQIQVGEKTKVELGAADAGDIVTSVAEPVRTEESEDLAREAQ